MKLNNQKKVALQVHSKNELKNENAYRSFYILRSKDRGVFTLQMSEICPFVQNLFTKNKS